MQVDQVITLTEQKSNLTESKRYTNVIRKMGAFEKYFHDEIEINGTINASTFIFSTKFDLFANKDVINQSVNYWKQTQPFLCSRVIERDNKSDLYFVYTSEEKIKNADNITYLYFKADDDQNSTTTPTTNVSDCKDYWKLLIEREFIIPIDWINGPMWRLMFIKLRQSEQADKFDYCLITTATHSVFDGHSAFQTLANLFYIIENVYTDKLKKELIRQAKVANTIEETVIKHLENIQNIGSYNKLDGFKQPASFCVKDIQTDRKIYIPVDELNSSTNEVKGAFYSEIDDSLYITLDKLLEISRNSLTKMYFISFQGDKFKRFISKCKLNNTKITGVINLMMVIAWRMAYENLNNNESRSKEITANMSSTSSDKYPILSTTKLSEVTRTQKINFSTIVNLRAHIKDIEQDALAWLCNSLYSSFDKDTDLSDPSFWNTTFWQYAREDSESFHDRLKRGEQFQIFESHKPLEADESRIHFGLSNMIIPNQATQMLKMFKIDQLYTTASYRKGWVNDLTYHNMININDNLFWIVSYNSYFMKNETVKIFINSIMEMYDILSAE